MRQRLTSTIGKTSDLSGVLETRAGFWRSGGESAVREVALDGRCGADVQRVVWGVFRLAASIQIVYFLV